MRTASFLHLRTEKHLWWTDDEKFPLICGEKEIEKADHIWRDFI